MTLKEAAESATRRLREAEARRLVTAGRERDEFDEMSDELEKHPIGLPRGRPCPECAEKDAEIARLRAVLERIGGPHDCGCWQKCHCDSQAELLIWKEEAKSAANEALAQVLVRTGGRTFKHREGE